MKVGIIGGGASGIFAAISAKKSGHDVTLYEKNYMIGRKLAATGSGRCNITNLYVAPEYYRSSKKNDLNKLINLYDFNFLKNYFDHIGIFTYHTDDGWVYPISNSAKNISMLLEEVLTRLNVKIHKNAEVIDIEKINNRFLVLVKDGQSSYYDRLILSSGSQAHPQLGSDSQVLNLSTKFGHRLINPYPALVPVVTTKVFTRNLDGVRCDAHLRLIKNNTLIDENFGNIIFTSWGLNGPGIMNLSHHVKNNTNIEIEIDFSALLPDKFQSLLLFSQSIHSLYSSLMSILNIKIIDQVFSNLKWSRNTNYSGTNHIELIQNLRIRETILTTKGFDQAQTSTGAVSTDEINPESLESKICPGLFFSGETLDIFGPCGGFNLHWAFISGIIAGKLGVA